MHQIFSNTRRQQQLRTSLFIWVLEWSREIYCWSNLLASQHYFNYYIILTSFIILAPLLCFYTTYVTGYLLLRSLADSTQSFGFIGRDSEEFRAIKHLRLMHKTHKSIVLNIVGHIGKLVVLSLLPRFVLIGVNNAPCSFCVCSQRLLWQSHRAALTPVCSDKLIKILLCNWWVVMCSL